MPRRPIAAGNWKMNGLRSALSEVEALHTAAPNPACQVLICPPATLLHVMGQVCAPMAIEVGAQNCHENSAGAHTGDISAQMIADAGAQYVILGHSERRAAYGENDALIAAKTRAAWAAGLTAIVCIGESLAEREAGKTLDVLSQQLAGSVPNGATADNLVLAYEPIWAIGTGLTPSLAEISEVHDALRGQLERDFATHSAGIRILYGGSMNPKNADQIIAVDNVDGGLVGGASLRAEDFVHIVNALSSD